MFRKLQTQIASWLAAAVLLASAVSLAQDNQSETDKLVEGLTASSRCLVINIFAYREKTTLLLQLYALRQIEDLKGEHERIAKPLKEEAEILESDIKNLREKLGAAGLEPGQISELISIITNAEIRENNALWTTSFGPEAVQKYLTAISTKHKWCKDHVKKVGGVKS